MAHDNSAIFSVPMSAQGSIENLSTGSNANCGSRQHVSGLLNHRAAQLRREAVQMHEQANNLEQLAVAVSCLAGPAEEALYRLAIDNPHGKRVGW